jgi:molybdopterin-guanine dinucleotide biosynthesis protein A
MAVHDDHSTPEYDGVVLAGGKAIRLGGVNKPEVTIGGRQLLDVAVEALDDADQVIVVGGQIATTRSVIWTRETSIGAGPVAALSAALELVRAPTVVLLAADLPFLTSAAVSALVSSRGSAVAVLAVDADDRDQPLLGAYDAAALRAAIPDETSGASMRSLLSRLSVIGRIERIDLGGSPPVTMDCDTSADFARAVGLANT